MQQLLSSTTWLDALAAAFDMATDLKVCILCLTVELAGCQIHMHLCHNPDVAAICMARSLHVFYVHELSRHSA